MATDRERAEEYANNVAAPHTTAWRMAFDGFLTGLAAGRAAAVEEAASWIENNWNCVCATTCQCHILVAAIRSLGPAAAGEGG